MAWNKLFNSSQSLLRHGSETPPPVTYAQTGNITNSPFPIPGTDHCLNGEPKLTGSADIWWNECISSSGSSNISSGSRDGK
eukprot:CAMPEP_0174977012 /NCGR_PEP_ID=MMETSP0004_2-20121128/13360_1 /TAXON_ID=420556 /ORGANISM="Ochromonas sp., Strain CCMP1393" /LENGTH=80 /DNA_ID=CAMNT_0016228123 /DNA_START=412 /DNA_END=657 /DNA_ORIENTATION=-